MRSVSFFKHNYTPLAGCFAAGVTQRAMKSGKHLELLAGDFLRRRGFADMAGSQDQQSPPTDYSLMTNSADTDSNLNLLQKEWETLIF